ncbi:MAG: 50S ribosomal protein L17 [Burkholderiales bacterium]|nr:50S ribosomal protein L17 [Phycisphaerae bacterium]
MRHMIRGRQLSRDTEHRIAMRRNLVQSLFEHGKVKTTLPKAKECQGFAEKLITIARTGTLTARRRVVAALNDRRVVDENQDFVLNEKGNPSTVVQRLFNEVAPRYKGRSGGYTRIIKTAKWRIGDAGTIVILELINEDKVPTGTIRRPAGLRKKRTEKKRAFAAKVLKKGDKTEAAAAEKQA